jgi:hypothetical protein
MSDIIRCYLDAGQPLYEQFEHHLVQHYRDRTIAIRFEQELVLDSRLLTFLVTLPDVQRGYETQYTRRLFLSYLPIEIPSIIHLEHVRGYDEPIGESSIEQAQEWLGMGQWWRRFKRQSWHHDALHIGPDVPLINGNMRLE